MKAKNLPMCKPEPAPMSDRVTELSRAYNICLALSTEKIVCNGIRFNDENRIFIVTGPNGGGKTVFAKAVGLAQILFQLGMFLPAEKARISPVDHLFTLFNAAENFDQRIGKFEEECQRVRTILDSATENSMILFNEAFNSTSYRDACTISENVMKSISAIGVRAMFVTHLHELAQNLEEMNDLPIGSMQSKFASLVALVDEFDNNAKKFRLVLKKSDGKSYADDIAKKYGLDYQSFQKTLV
jgi:DNA mismatch repair ATPase MutS